MSDPRGWSKHEDAIEKAKKEILAALAEGGAIKSIQRGVIDLSGEVHSATVEISEVNIDKSFIVPTGREYYCTNMSGSGGFSSMMLDLTSPTSVTATRATSYNRDTARIGYQVIEFN